MTVPSVFRATALLLLGPLLWAFAFFTSYAAHGTLCAAGDRLAVLSWLLPSIAVGATFIPAFAALRPLTVARAFMPGEDESGELAFIASVMQLLAILSCLATLMLAVVVGMLPACAMLR